MSRCRKKTIRKLLAAITEGVGKGELSFSEGDDGLVMAPDGLLPLKLKASKEDGHHSVSIRISWQEKSVVKAGKKSLKVNGLK